MKLTRGRKWKMAFFFLVLLSLILLNLLMAPMMFKCSNIIIAMMQKSIGTAGVDYCKIGIFLGSTEIYILVIACVGIFVSRQSAFYYQVCYSMAIFTRFMLRIGFRSSRPFMVKNDVEPYVCLMSYGTPDCAIMELVTMAFVICKNPSSSLYLKSAGSKPK